jgi:hypothetical protein
MQLKPPKEEAPGLGGTSRKTDRTPPEYHHAQRLQASLRHRSNRVVSIGELMPGVFAATMAQLRLAAHGGRYGRDACD